MKLFGYFLNDDSKLPNNTADNKRFAIRHEVYVVMRSAGLPLRASSTPVECVWPPKNFTGSRIGVLLLKFSGFKVEQLAKTKRTKQAAIQLFFMIAIEK